MINIKKHILYWKRGSEEDWKAAETMLQRKHVRHALFFVHLSLEKILKANVCVKIKDLAPRIHNLVRLAELSCLIIPSDAISILAEINSFNIEGRYPELLLKPPKIVEAREYFLKAKRVLIWLKKQLPKK